MNRQLLIMVLLFACFVGASSQVYKNPEASIESRVNDLLSRMTLEEKVAQMGMTSLDKFMDQEIPYGVCESPFVRVEDIAALSSKVKRYAREKNRLGIPPIQIAECLHGFLAHGSTIFPQAIAQGSSWNPGLIKEMGSIIALEASAAGVDQALSPLFDIIRDPRYGRVEECFGEDGYLVGVMGDAFVRGMQGEPEISRNRIAANKLMCTAKHFAGYTTPVAGINLGPSSLGERELRSTFLPPFKKSVVESHIYSVMPSYNEMDGIPAHANKFLLDQILRKEWGFQGYVFSDYGGISMLMNFHKTTDQKEVASRAAILAGVDVEAPSSYTFQTLVGQVNRGEVPIAVIDTCVKRILRVKFKAGLFEKAYADSSSINKVIHQPEAVSLARQIAEESIILLKNEKDLLPLDEKRLTSLAVIGPNANQVQYGDYSYTKSNQSGVTIYEGLKTALKGRANVSYAKGCSISGLSKDGFEEALSVAANADQIVFVMGGTSATLSGIGWGVDEADQATDPNTCGEGFDVTDLNPLGVQRELLQELKKTGKPIVLVLVHGRPWSIDWEKENIPAILEAWYPGERGGEAVANILLGKVNPSGRLTVSIPQTVGHVPVFYDYKPSGRGYYHKRGTKEKPGRDYVFSSPDPLFPFGFGLSYTRFEYSNLQLSNDKFGKEERLKISVDIKNVGNRAGKEVVQLYVNDKLSSTTTPVIQLKGFTKELLREGESRTVTFLLSAEDLGLWNNEMEYVTEPGEFEIMIGKSAEDIQLSKSVMYVE